MSASGFDPLPKDDAVMFYRIAATKFGELGALFDTIARRLDKHDDLRKLAVLGFDVAVDYENQSGCWREHLEKAGFKQ